MTLGQSYKVKITAETLLDPNLKATKEVHIDTDSPDV